MTLSPAMKRRIDRVFLILTGLAVFVVIASLVSQTDQRDNAGRIFARGGLILLVLVRAVPWLATRYAALRSARSRRAERPHIPPDAAIASPRGLRRMDFYVAVAALVLIAGLFASSRRYTVTHYKIGTTLVFQRTDGWTGRAELWSLSRGQGERSAATKPAWVKFSGEQSAER